MSVAPSTGPMPVSAESATLSMLVQRARLDRDVVAAALDLRRDELRRLNRSPWATALRIGAASRWLDAHRATITAYRPLFPLATLDLLGRLPHALTAVDAARDAAVRDVGAAAAHAALVRRRDVLLADVRPLVARGLLSDALLDQVRGGVGYGHVGPDIALLAGAVRRIWPAIAGRTLLTEAELDTLERTPLAIAAIAERRLDAERIEAAAVELRARVFTLIVTLYAQVERELSTIPDLAEGFARHVPKLYAREDRRRSRAASAG